MSVGVVSGLLFAVLLVLGAPLFLCIGVTTVVSLALIDSGGTLGDLASLLFTSMDQLQNSDQLLEVMNRVVNVPMEVFEKSTALPVMIAIPLFTLAGTIITEGVIASRLINLIKAVVGFLPSGLALASMVGCAFFAALSGSSVVTIMAIGGALYPAMVKEGYGERFSLGLITSSGALGILAPPSLPLIIYGAVTQTDINQLFIAGILPIALSIGCLSLLSITYGAFSKTVQRERFSFAEVVDGLKKGVWALLFPIFLLVVIYGGYATPTEASALAVLYAILVECVIYRKIKFRDLPRLTVQTMVLVGGILMILLMALAYTYYLADQSIPDKMTELIQQYVTTPMGFLVAVNVLLLIVGCMMDILSAILIVAPLLVPVAEAYGINLVHLGIIFVINLEIGFLTPPFGISLFVSSNFFRRSSAEVILASAPFVLMLFLALGLITVFPEISLYLVNLAAR